MWSDDVEKALTQVRNGGANATAGGVASLTAAVAQLLSASLGVDTMELQRCVQQVVHTLLEVCGQAAAADDVALLDTAKDALQLVSWQMVLRGQGDQRVFLGTLLDCLRADHPTPHVQRTALQVASALCKVTDSTLQPLLLSGFAPPLALLMAAPEKHLAVLKVLGDCAKQFSPYILPGGSEEHYKVLLEGATVLLGHADDVVRRQAAVAVAAIACNGRPCRVADMVMAFTARYEVCVRAGSKEETTEAKGVAVLVAEMARHVASDAYVLQHALVPMLRSLAAMSSDVVRRFTSLELDDISLLTAVLDAVSAVLALLEGPHRVQVLDISGWGKAAEVQLGQLVPWLEGWGGRGFERAVASCITHVGLLSQVAPKVFAELDTSGLLMRLAAHDDLGIRCEAILACGCVAASLLRSANVSLALSHLRSVVTAQRRVLGDARSCASTQKSCLLALSAMVPTLLKGTQRECFVAAQDALQETLSTHAAAREKGMHGRVWTVQIEVLSLCAAVPWRLMTDLALIDAALWWCTTLCCDTDLRVRAKACRAFTQLLAKLPFAISFEALSPPNRLRAATTRHPQVCSGYTSVDTLLLAKDASCLDRWHSNASVLIAEETTVHNIGEALKHTLGKLATIMGGMHTGTLPDAFSGTLRVLSSLAREYGHHGGEYQSTLAQHSESAVGLLLRALRILLRQSHMQLRVVSEVVLTIAGFVTGSSEHLQVEVYRTLLVQLALQWSLMTAAISQRLAGTDAGCPPKEIVRAAEAQVAACDVAAGVDTTCAFVDESVVKAVAAAKAVAHKVVYRSAPTDGIPEGFAGLCEVCLTLLTSLVEEAADQQLVCALTSALLRVVSLHRHGQPKLVLDLLRAMFRTSYGHPDVHRQRVPLPIERTQPVGAVRMTRLLKGAPNAAPLADFLNPILESVQLYFRSMDANVQPAVVRLLYSLHCRGVDFSMLDPTSEIAVRLRCATERQMDAWTGRDGGDAAQLTPPITHPVPLLRLLHQITPAVAKRERVDGAEVARHVLTRAAQSSTPQLAEALLPYLVGVGRKDDVVKYFIENLSTAVPCGGYTLSLCVQVLRAARDKPADAAHSTGDVPWHLSVKESMLRVAAYVTHLCELDWLGMDHGHESVDSLCEVARILHQRELRAGSTLDSEIAASLSSLATTLLSSGRAVSLAAALSLTGGALTTTVLPLLLTQLKGDPEGLPWLERYGVLRTVSQLDVEGVSGEVLGALMDVVFSAEHADARVVACVVKLVRRTLQAAWRKGDPSGVTDAVFPHLLTSLKGLLEPWVPDDDTPPVAPPIPSALLLQATLVYDCTLYLLSEAPKVNKRWWQKLLTAPSALLCCFLHAERNSKMHDAVVSAVHSVHNAVAHPLIDTAILKVARSTTSGDPTERTTERLTRFLSRLSKDNLYGPKITAFLAELKVGVVVDGAAPNITHTAFAWLVLKGDVAMLQEVCSNVRMDVVAAASSCIVGASPVGLPMVFATVCTEVTACLSRVLYRDGEGGKETIPALRTALSTLAVFLRDHLQTIRVEVNLSKTVHLLLVAFAAAYDAGGWECSVSVLSLFALVHCWSPPELDVDVLQQQGDVSRCYSWNDLSDTSTAAVSSQEEHAGSLPQILLAAIPQDAAWRGFVTRAAHHTARCYGITTEYDASAVVSPPESLELAVHTVAEVLLALPPEDLSSVASMIGFAVCQSAPSSLYSDVLEETAMCIEDGIGLDTAVLKVLRVIAGVGCPKPWDALLKERVLEPLLAYEGDTEYTVHCARVLAALLGNGAGGVVPTHCVATPHCVGLAGHPDVLTMIMSHVRMMSPKETSGERPWHLAGVLQRRNSHWATELPAPEHHVCNIAESAAQMLVACSEVLSRSNRVDTAVVVGVLQELALGVVAAGVHAFAPHSVALAGHLNALLDKAPREVLPLRDHFYPLQGEAVMDGLAECYNTEDRDTPAFLTCSDAGVTENVAVLLCALGAAKDVGTLLTHLASSACGAAAGVYLCVALLADMRRGDVKSPHLERAVPALAGRVANDLLVARSLPRGTAFLFSSVMQMVACCIDVVPSACEAAAFTRNAWGALWPSLAEVDANPLSSARSAGVFAQAYHTLLHYSLSHAQRSVIAALTVTPPEEDGRRGAVTAGDLALLSDAPTLLMLGVMLCAQYPALGCAPRLDDDGAHRQVLKLVSVLGGGAVRKQTEPLVAAVGFIVKRGLHWQQGLPLCLQELLLSQRAHRALLPGMLPAVLTGFISEQAGTASAENSWAWVQALLDGCSRRQNDVYIWTISVVLLSVCIASGDAFAELLLKEAEGSMLWPCCVSFTVFFLGAGVMPPWGGLSTGRVFFHQLSPFLPAILLTYA